MTPTPMFDSKPRLSTASTLVGLAVLASIWVTLMLSGAVAQGALTHPYTGQSFGPAGTGPGTFSRVVGVAIDQNNGDLFVYDAGDTKVYKFDEAGNPVDFSALGSNAIGGVGGPSGSESEIAVDNSSGPGAGNIYVANTQSVLIFNSSGEFLGKLTGGETCGVAVDSSGAVYVGVYPGTVRKYESLASPVTNADETSSMVGLNGVCNVAVDGEGNVYAATYSGGVSRYDALQFGSSAAIGTEVDKFGRTLAVDPASNDVYVNEVTKIVEYDSSGLQLTESAAGQLGSSFGVAVRSGSSGNLYVPANTDRMNIYGPTATLPDATTRGASNITETTATVSGQVNPQETATTYYFEYGPTTEYGSVSPVSPATVGSDSSLHSLSTELIGLTPATTYHYRIVASNANGSTPGADASFRTQVHPQIDEESASSVGSASAKLNAQVNDFGFVGTYYYEYGTGSSYGSTTPEAILGAAEGDIGAPALLEGLQPGTVYHYRIVVKNEAGTVRGVDAQFSTQPVSASGLPDRRVYEMVSPPNNQNANVYVPALGVGDLTVVDTSLPFQASLDGDAISYAAEPSLGGNGNIGAGSGNEYLARRFSDGWTQTNVQPLGMKSVSYQAFSSDLDIGFLDSCNSSILSPEAAGGGYDVLYSHAIGGSSYVPFLKQAPPNRTKGEFGTAGLTGLGAGGCKSVIYAGSSSGQAHVLFEANDALTTDAISDPPSVNENDLYDWTDGSLKLVNILPGASGAVAPDATFGSFMAGAGADFSHVISADGSRIFWQDRKTGNLYVREDSGTPAAQTVQVDASVGGGGSFWDASNTGSRVFFIKAGDLYSFDTGTGQTADLAPGGEVLGLSAASEDGSYVYYVAQAALTGDAIAGQPNLYLSRYDGAAWTAPVLLATLSPNDSNENPERLVGGVWVRDLGKRTAEATPDGHNLVFESLQPLTGYDTGGLREVYVYDADTGGLACASCNPSGELAHREPYRLLPISSSRNRQPHVISPDGGRVFFNDPDALVPGDTNGRWDVYEWERAGSGDCHLDNGCIFPLSGGTSAGGSYFADASLSGNDVFIVTRAKLTSADQNDNVDIYDASVDGRTPPSPPACSGSGCQGVPPAPPIFATPSSATFNGVGNFSPPRAVVKPRSKTPTRAQRLSRALKACAKKQRRKRTACEVQARKRYGAKSKAKKSTKGRK